MNIFIKNRTPEFSIDSFINVIKRTAMGKNGPLLSSLLPFS